MNIKELSTSSLRDILELLQMVLSSSHDKNRGLLDRIEKLDQLSQALENLDEESIKEFQEVIFDELEKRVN